MNVGDGNLRDFLAERLLRLEHAQGETNQRLDRANERLDRTNERLDQAVDVLGSMTNVLMALKDGQDRLIDRVDHLAEAITRGFTERDEKIEAIRRGVEWLEQEVRKDPSPPS